MTLSCTETAPDSDTGSDAAAGLQHTVSVSQMMLTAKGKAGGNAIRERMVLDLSTQADERTSLSCTTTCDPARNRGPSALW